MKILIDMQGCQGESRFRGIGRYSDLFVKHLLDADSPHEYHLLLNGAFVNSAPEIRAEFSSWIPPDRVHVFLPVGEVQAFQAKNRWRREASAIVRDAAIASVGPDLVLLTSLFEGYQDSAVVTVSGATPWKVFSIVYDMIPLVFKETYLKDPRYAAFYREKLEELKRCDGLLAISQHSAKEVVDYLGFEPSRIATIGAGLGIEPKFLSSYVSKSALQRLGIVKSFVLYVPGGYDSRKNFGRLIEAWMRLPESQRKKYQLVFGSRIGDRNQVEKPAKKAGLRPGDFVFTGYVSDDVLVQLYKSCALFVFPSLHEGFGLPVLEAMACGAAVIGSNTSSLPEVIGLEEALFDPLDPDSIAAKIRCGLEDTGFVGRLRVSARRQTKVFAWEQCAQRGLEALEHLDRVSSRGGGVSASFALGSALEQILGLRSEKPSIPTESDFILASVSLGHLVPRGGVPKIYIDISALAEQDARTGIQRVVRAVLQSLPGLLGSKYEPHLVYGKGNELHPSASRYHEASEWISKQEDLGSYLHSASDEAIDPRAGDIFLGLDLSAHLFPVFTAEISRLRARGVRVFFVVYDLIPLNYPQYCDAGMVEVFGKWMHSITRNSDGLFCISRAVSEELSDWIHENVPAAEAKTNIGWFHLGADIQATRPSMGLPANAAQVLSQLKARPTFLMVGTLEPRKGHRFVLEAFDQVWESGTDVNLVFVGKLGWKMEDLALLMGEHPEKRSRFFWFEGASDEFLEAIYGACVALVTASEVEGYGLPIIEAAQRGLPVIARDIPVFREVAQDGATYFDGEDPTTLVAVVVDFASGGSSTKGARTKNQIPWLTWVESTQQLLSLVSEEFRFARRASKLYIDISALVERDARTGIQRVVRAFLGNLPDQLGAEYEPHLVYGDQKGQFHEASCWTSEQEGLSYYYHASTDEVIAPRAGDIFLGLDLSAHLFPVFTPEIARFRTIGVQVYFVVYDLIPVLSPQFCDAGLVRAFGNWLDAITRNSDGLFCISRSVSQELTEWIHQHVPSNEATARVGWFHLGADIRATRPSMGLPENASELLSQFKQRPTFLMVGTVEPRKGHNFVLDAFNRLWAAGAEVNLAVVGRLGWRMEELASIMRSHPEAGNRFFWIEGPSDEFLESIYSASVALVAASEAEGFGLPIIEAAQRGLPVIARDIPVFREVAQDGATYFDGENPAALVKVVETYISHGNSKAGFRSQGEVGCLTWAESTQRLLSLVLADEVRTQGHGKPSETARKTETNSGCFLGDIL